MLDQEQKRIWTENGLENLRYEYPLTKDSLVVDIGACTGTFCNEINRIYGCRVMAYEPLSGNFKILKSNANKDVQAFRFAVGDMDTDFMVGIGSEMLEFEGNEFEKVKMVHIDSVINEFTDLVKINIEGGEYNVLTAISDEKLSMVGNFQVQFHMVDGYEEMYEKISKRLSVTHELTYRYPFCWENWRLKE